MTAVLDASAVLVLLLDERGADLIVSQRASTDAFGGRLPETLGTRLATVPGVASVTGEMIASPVSGSWFGCMTPHQPAPAPEA